MNHLRHIVEPTGLLLTWQPADERAPDRARRAVAKIENAANDTITFEYLADTADYKKALDAGFQGHPAFDLKNRIYSTGVTEALLRRLPPRKREDFPEFLRLHRLPHPFSYSDFALLAYTGARLPSDGFSIVPLFEPEVAPCDYIVEVAGFRHAPDADLSNMKVDDSVQFVIEPDNLHDNGAVAIMHNGKRIGYVNRILKETFQNWLKLHNVSAKIARLNGNESRPLVYLWAEISPK